MKTLVPSDKSDENLVPTEEPGKKFGSFRSFGEDSGSFGRVWYRQRSRRASLIKTLVP